MVIGEEVLVTDTVGAEVEGGGVGATVTVELLGAGLIRGTFMDDIITTGGAGDGAETVFTTTAALDLTGS